MTYRVLLPFDGSRASLHAVRHVARSLEGLDAKVLLLNVQQVVVDAEMLYAARSIAHVHRQEGEALLRPAMAILERHGIRHEAEVAFGPPAAVIARLAEERHYALIVMGTRARNPIVEFFARSVAVRVRRKTRVPVMLVREDASSRGLPPRDPVFTEPLTS